MRVRRLASRFVADTQLDGGVVLPVIYRGGQRSARAWCFAWNDKGVLGAMRATGGFGPDSCVRRMEVVSRRSARRIASEIVGAIHFQEIEARLDVRRAQYELDKRRGLAAVRLQAMWRSQLAFRHVQRVLRAVRVVQVGWRMRLARRACTTMDDEPEWLTEAGRQVEARWRRCDRRRRFRTARDASLLLPGFWTVQEVWRPAGCECWCAFNLLAGSPDGVKLPFRSSGPGVDVWGGASCHMR